jgi:hypothetical protein
MSKFNIKPAEKFRPPIPSKELREMAMMDIPAVSLRKLQKRQHLMKVIKGEILPPSVTSYPDVNERGKFKKAGVRAKLQISDDELSQAPSEMALITEQILELLDQEDSDGAITLTQKHLLRTVLLMLPQAERMIHASKSARGVHNFSQLVNQIREIMADIQMSRDNKFLATGINIRVIQPAMIDITNHMITSGSIMRQQVSDYVPVEHRLTVSTLINDHLKATAKYMEQQYKSMSVKVEESLS